MEIDKLVSNPFSFIKIFKVLIVISIKIVNTRIAGVNNNPSCVFLRSKKPVIKNPGRQIDKSIEKIGLTGKPISTISFGTEFLSIGGIISESQRRKNRHAIVIIYIPIVLTGILTV